MKNRTIFCGLTFINSKTFGGFNKKSYLCTVENKEQL